MTKAKVGALGAIGALLGVGAYGLLGAATTPIGTASELSGWPQGRADAPLCIYGRVSDGGLTCVALLGTQDGGDVIPGSFALWRDGGAPYIMPSGDNLTIVRSQNLQQIDGSPSGFGFVQNEYPDGGGRRVGLYVDSTGAGMGTASAHDLLFFAGAGDFEAGLTNSGGHVWADGGILFHDGTIQTSAASGGMAVLNTTVYGAPVAIGANPTSGAAVTCIFHEDFAGSGLVDGGLFYSDAGPIFATRPICTFTMGGVVKGTYLNAGLQCASSVSGWDCQTSVLAAEGIDGHCIGTGI